MGVEVGQFLRAKKEGGPLHALSCANPCPRLTPLQAVVAAVAEGLFCVQCESITPLTHSQPPAGCGGCGGGGAVLRAGHAGGGSHHPLPKGAPMWAGRGATCLVLHSATAPHGLAQQGEGCISQYVCEMPPTRRVYKGSSLAGACAGVCELAVPLPFPPARFCAGPNSTPRSPLLCTCFMVQPNQPRQGSLVMHPTPQPTHPHLTAGWRSRARGSAAGRTASGCSQVPKQPVQRSIGSGVWALACLHVGGRGCAMLCSGWVGRGPSAEAALAGSYCGMREGPVVATPHKLYTHCHYTHAHTRNATTAPAGAGVLAAAAAAVPV